MGEVEEAQASTSQPHPGEAAQFKSPSRLEMGRTLRKTEDKEVLRQFCQQRAASVWRMGPPREAGPYSESQTQKDLRTPGSKFFITEMREARPREGSR